MVRKCCAPFATDEDANVVQPWRAPFANVFAGALGRHHLEAADFVTPFD